MVAANLSLLGNAESGQCRAQKTILIAASTMRDAQATHRIDEAPKEAYNRGVA